MVSFSPKTKQALLGYFKDVQRAVPQVGPAALGAVSNVYLAYELGRWVMGGAPKGGGISLESVPPPHNPSSEVDAFLAALSGAVSAPPKKRRRKKNRYTELVKKEMKRYNEKGVRGKNLPAKEKFRLAANRAKKSFDKEKRNAKKRNK